MLIRKNTSISPPLKHPPKELRLDFLRMRKLGWLSTFNSKLIIYKFDINDSRILRRVPKKGSLYRLTIDFMSHTLPQLQFKTNLPLYNFKNLRELSMRFQSSLANLNPIFLTQPVQRYQKLQLLTLRFSPNLPYQDVQQTFLTLKPLRAITSFSLIAKMSRGCGDALTQLIDRFEKLNQLNLSVLNGEKITKELLSCIGRKHRLKNLRLSFKEDLDRDEFLYIKNAIEPLDLLRAFSLKCRIFDETFEDDTMALLSIMSNRPYLTFLKLSLGSTNTVKENFFKDLSSHLLKMTKLTYFRFQVSNAFFINEEACEALGYSLKCLPKLKKLHLILPLIRPGWTFLKSLSPLQALTSLKLDFYGGRITDASLKAFAESGFLKGLLSFNVILADCKKITGEGLRAVLSNVKSLKKLSLWIGEYSMEPEPTEMLIKDLCLGIRMMSQLMSFKLVMDGQVTDRSMQTLAQALKYKPELINLKLDFRLAYQITDKGFNALAEGLTYPKKIENFLLWARPEPAVTIRGVAGIVHSIMRMQFLHELSLMWTYTSQASNMEVELLKNKIYSHKRLVHLDFEIEKKSPYKNRNPVWRVLKLLMLVLSPMMIKKFFVTLLSIKIRSPFNK